jgi:hypothetical protein
LFSKNTQKLAKLKELICSLPVNPKEVDNIKNRDKMDEKAFAF